MIIEMVIDNESGWDFHIGHTDNLQNKQYDNEPSTVQNHNYGSHVEITGNEDNSVGEFRVAVESDDLEEIKTILMIEYLKYRYTLGFIEMDHRCDDDSGNMPDLWHDDYDDITFKMFMVSALDKNTTTAITIETIMDVTFSMDTLASNWRIRISPKKENPLYPPSKPLVDMFDYICEQEGFEI